MVNLNNEHCVSLVTIYLLKSVVFWVITRRRVVIIYFTTS
jgi:hypothetical protein